jgi:hypothetical protein
MAKRKIDPVMKRFTINLVGTMLLQDLLTARSLEVGLDRLKEEHAAAPFDPAQVVRVKLVIEGVVSNKDRTGNVKA